MDKRNSFLERKTIQTPHTTTPSNPFIKNSICFTQTLISLSNISKMSLKTGRRKSIIQMRS